MKRLKPSSSSNIFLDSSKRANTLSLSSFCLLSLCDSSSSLSPIKKIWIKLLAGFQDKILSKQCLKQEMFLQKNGYRFISRSFWIFVSGLLNVMSLLGARDHQYLVRLESITQKINIEQYMQYLVYLNPSLRLKVTGLRTDCPNHHHRNHLKWIICQVT